MHKILIFLLFYSSLYAIATITIDTKEIHIKSFALEYFIDDAAKLNITDLKNKHFTKSAQSDKSFKLSNPVAWLRFNIYNNTNETRTLHLHNHFGYVSSKLDFYEVTQKKISQELHINFNNPEDSQQKMYATDAIFDIQLEANQTKTIYIKSQMNDIHIMNYVLYDTNTSRKILSNKSTYELLFVGIFVGLAFYYLILAIASRYKEYIYFILFLFSVTFWELQISGTLAHMIGFYYSQQNLYFSLILLCVPIFLLLFFKTILKTKVHYAILDKLFNSVIFLFFILLFIGIFSPKSALSLGAYAFIYLFIILFIASYILIKRKNPLALYFTVGNIFFSSLSFVSDLFFMGFFNYSIWAFHAVNIGFFIEFVALGFMFSWKVHQYRDNEKALMIEKELTLINDALEVRIDEEVKLSHEKDKAMFAQRKMASMGEMIENIAHQWRQPLSEVNASVFAIDTIVYEKYKNDKAIEEELKNIEKLTDYMSRTINNFQNFFDQNKEKRLFSIEEILNSSLVLIEKEFQKKSIEIIKNIKDEIIYNGYFDELQQTLLIILNNAKDVLVSQNIKNPTIIIGVQNTANNLLISLCDNGGGVEDTIIDNIFEPYFTTKHKTQGTGLGLYISKVIIEESMRGDITVSNSKDGACFTILLPLEKEI